MRKIIKRRVLEEAKLNEFGNLHPIIARVLLARGCTNTSEVSYQLKNILPPNLKDIDKAAELLEESLKNQDRILVVGDFDVDGATSTSLVVKYLTQLGYQNVDYIVPNRFEYGYGLTPEIVQICKTKNPNLIVTVDNGISSIEGVLEAKSLGIKVLITDHHLPGNTLPEADAIVNPNQVDCHFPSKSLAGVGVAFYTMLALRNRLIANNWFSETNPVPNIAEHLDLVALGTVADVVRLDYNNRILVDRGIKRIRNGNVCEGIKAILSIANRDSNKLQSTDLGFSVGPRLNAAGRLDDMTVGIKCLLSKDKEEALDLAKRLDSLNVERREIESVMNDEANQLLEKLFLKLHGVVPSGLCLYSPDWHQGVIGILASRIKEKLFRPVIIFASDKEGMLKGSGRSIPDIHLRDTLDKLATENPGLLTKFGGHAMAAGLSLSEDKLDEFTVKFEQEIERQFNSVSSQACIETDGELPDWCMHVEFAKELSEYGPWGQNFPEPIFDGKFKIIQKTIIGDKHLKFLLKPENATYTVVDAIYFNANIEAFKNPLIENVHIVYKPVANEFRGNVKLQLLVDYIEPC